MTNFRLGKWDAEIWRKSTADELVRLRAPGSELVKARTLLRFLSEKIFSVILLILFVQNQYHLQDLQFVDKNESKIRPRADT